MAKRTIGDVEAMIHVIEWTVKVSDQINIKNRGEYYREMQKTIDYLKELLDINIYTLSNIFIHDDSVQIHKTTEKNAYLNIYNYYKYYDYIWIINSNNIITEPSLLNDLLSSNKSICS